MTNTRHRALINKEKSIIPARQQPQKNRERCPRLRHSTTDLLHQVGCCRAAGSGAHPHVIDHRSPVSREQLATEQPLQRPLVAAAIATIRGCQVAAAQIRGQG